MNEMIIIIICVLSLFTLKIGLNIKIKEILKFKYKENKELDEITAKLPANEEVCKEILSNLGNISNVTIKNEEETNDCLYMIFNNTILLGKFKADFIRIQTIAHECIHSVQNKITLWFNYLFSNLYIIYFILISILTLFNKIQNTNVQIIILFILGIVQYSIRAYLENEAMNKAPYIAKEYLANKNISNEDVCKLMKEYIKINSIGIPFVNYTLIQKNIIKIIAYCALILI